MAAWLCAHPVQTYFVQIWDPPSVLNLSLPLGLQEPILNFYALSRCDHGRRPAGPLHQRGRPANRFGHQISVMPSFVRLVRLLFHPSKTEPLSGFDDLMTLDHHITGSLARSLDVTRHRFSWFPTKSHRMLALAAFVCLVMIAIGFHTRVHVPCRRQSPIVNKSASLPLRLPIDGLGTEDCRKEEEEENRKRPSQASRQADTLILHGDHMRLHSTR